MKIRGAEKERVAPRVSTPTLNISIWVRIKYMELKREGERERGRKMNYHWENLCMCESPLQRLPPFRWIVRGIYNDTYSYGSDKCPPGPLSYSPLDTCPLGPPFDLIFMTHWWVTYFDLISSLDTCPLGPPFDLIFMTHWWVTYFGLINCPLLL